MISKIDSRYIVHDENRICQGDIFRDIKYIEKVRKEKGQLISSVRTFPHIVILSQECDLLSDYENRLDTTEGHDKFMESILVSPAYYSKNIRKGEHLKQRSYQMQRINSRKWDYVKKNEIPRYHYLHAELDQQMPEMVIDFKHYYTIHRDYLYSLIDEHYHYSMNELFRERLSQRFASYLSRIGLPVIPPLSTHSLPPTEPVEARPDRCQS